MRVSAVRGLAYVLALSWVAIYLLLRLSPLAQSEAVYSDYAFHPASFLAEPGANAFSVMSYAFLHGIPSRSTFAEIYGVAHLTLNTLVHLSAIPQMESWLKPHRLGDVKLLLVFLSGAVVGAVGHALTAYAGLTEAFSLAGASSGICALVSASYMHELRRYGFSISWLVSLGVFLGVNIGLLAWIDAAGVAAVAWHINAFGFLAGAICFVLVEISE